MSLCEIVIGPVRSKRDIFGRPKGNSGGTLVIETLNTRIHLGMKYKGKGPNNTVEFSIETGEMEDPNPNKYYSAKRVYQAVNEAISTLEGIRTHHSTQTREREDVAKKIAILQRIQEHEEETLEILKPKIHPLDYKQEAAYSGTELRYRGEHEGAHKFAGRDSNKNRYTILVRHKERNEYEITGCVTRWRSTRGPHSEIRRSVDLTQVRLSSELEYTYLTLQEETNHAERHFPGIQVPKK